jgi:hypothetical protein
VLLYELLTGHTPVDRKSFGKAALLEVLRIVREVEAPRPSAKLSTIDTLPSVAANRGTEPAKLSKMMKGELDWVLLKALEMAVTRRLPDEGLLAHSDRGSQYASDHYQRLLGQHGIECSMSAVGQCWDNAPMESFFASLKKELVHHEDYRNRAEAKASIFEYIETFYNPKRRHSALCVCHGIPESLRLRVPRSYPRVCCGSVRRV